MQRTHYIGSVVYPIKGTWRGTLQRYQIFYMGDSSSEVTINGKKYHTPADSIYLMYPEIPYLIEFSHQQESTHYWIHINDSGHLLNKLQLLKNDFYQFTGVEIFKQYMELALTFRAHEEFQVSAHSFVLNFLETYIDYCFQKPMMTDSFSEKVLLTINYLRKNYKNEITLNELANEIHASPEHLIRLFKKAKLPSPMAYLRDLRIKRSVELMKSTNLSLKEIGDQVGIPDQYQFSKLVKKSTGKTSKIIRNEK
jgi:YesN/AraC family two-component response regulator